MATVTPELIYKIVSREVWESFSASGRFPGIPIDVKDGYVHLSTAAQLGETFRLHFAGQRGLALFAVRTAELGPALRWEPSRGGQLFPHLYGELTMSAVGDRATDVDVAVDGTVSLPGWVR
jgi:uncharacterized protein (DUF952 family)